MTTKHNQQERARYTEAAKEALEKADKKADEVVDGGITILQKLKEKKWTAAAVVGSGLLAAFLFFK